jgi:transglutaminase-like putative cysteine protease
MEELTNREDFLPVTSVVNWRHPAVLAQAKQFGGDGDMVKTARRCFEWVRDEIQHCLDFGRPEVTCNASDVLAHGTGFCYAKSHLLAALLRANGIPAGFCYQRLSFDGTGPSFCLHGLNAVWLEEFGWYRLDPRGNKPGVSTQFTPPVERLAFAIQVAGEFDVPGVFAEPLPQIVAALASGSNAQQLAGSLPDVKRPADLPPPSARV